MTRGDVLETEPHPAPGWVNLSRRGIRLLPRGRYPLMNWLCRREVAPFDTSLGVTHNRVRFVCDLRDGIAREACFMGFYEPQETVLLQSLLRPGMTFVDIGANWGYFTLLAADLVGPAGRVVSFEPHPALYQRLAQNVGRNHFEWVTTLQVAVAGAEGEMNLAGYAAGTTNWGVSRLTVDAEPGTSNFRVRTATLESLLDAQGAAEVDMLKMDIEGAEGSVLPTMRQGLSRGRYQRILLELHPSALSEQGIAAENLVGELLAFGYRGWRVDHSAAAFRRASYKLPSSPEEVLRPIDLHAPIEAWPHFLFLAPGVGAPWREASAL